MFLLLVSGCSHNIDSMIENYNSKIPVEEKYYFVDNPGPGEPGFIPEDMLEVWAVCLVELQNILLVEITSLRLIIQILKFRK